MATEAVVAVTELAARMRIGRLYGLRHLDNTASAQVLGRAGFIREGVLHRYLVFPNLAVNGPQDVDVWVAQGRRRPGRS